jgi:hypothetical protein
MTNWAALDVAIGIVAVYFLISLIASTINESIATALGWRSRFLEAWLRNVLVDPGKPEEAETKLENFFNHALLAPLLKQPRWWSTKQTMLRRPSYIPSTVFAATLFKPDLKSHARSHSKALDEAIADLPSTQLQEVITSIRREVGDDVDKIRQHFERWYDDSMERVSGWYKRRTHLALAVIGLVVAIVLNVDTLQIGRTLWVDKTIRAAVVAEAGKVTQNGQDAKSLTTVANQVRQIKALNIPIGWKLTKGDPRDLPHSTRLWAAKCIGILMTMLATMLGAPFWFDLLSKIVKLRGSGAPPPVSEPARSGTTA